MKLAKFTVEKYRSILSKSELTIGDYTAILGPNNQGKSNLLRGLNVALRAIKQLVEIFSFRHNRVVQKRVLARVMKDIYDWEVDYPIQRRHDKRVKDDSKRLSKFALHFVLDDFDHNILSRIYGVKDHYSDITIRMSFGKEIIETSVSAQRSGSKSRSMSGLKEQSVLRYIAGSMSLCYIDAERTAKTARQSIATLIELPIEKQLETDEYRQFLRSLHEKRQKVLSSISQNLTKSLCEFLPAIETAQIQTDTIGLYRRSFLPRSVDILIDDGVETSLQQKGSGVQSLIAISLAKYISQSEKRGSANLILAIEEPETHLHSRAIHQVKETLEKISRNTPVLITTHSPLLVNLHDIESNIIVNDNEACPAKSVKDIKQVLGVQRYDNLTNADCIVVVEGISDQRILEALFRLKSPLIAKALNTGHLSICNAHGCSNMGAIITQVKMDLGRYHVVLDNDKAAWTIYEKLIKQIKVARADVTLLKSSCLENGESELEDTLDDNVYWDALSKKYSLRDVSCLPKKARSLKWSEKMRMLHNNCGGVWTEEIEEDFKTVVANEVVKSPAKAVRAECKCLYDSLITRVEKMLSL